MNYIFNAKANWFCFVLIVLFTITPGALGAQVPARSAESEVVPVESMQSFNSTAASLKLDAHSSQVIRSVVLERFDESAKSAVTSHKRNVPAQIGIGRIMPLPYSEKIDLSNLKWIRLDSGGQASLLTVTSSGAKAMRMALSVSAIAEGIEIRFFGIEAPERVFGPYTARELLRDGSQIEKSKEGNVPHREPFWSPVIEGETIGMEIFIPAGQRQDQLSFTIPQIAHLWQSVVKSGNKNLNSIGNSEPCEVDIACNTEGWGPIADSVVKYVYTYNFGTHVCTGTLLADNDADTSIPYLLTANHCVSLQEQADNINTYWFFQKSACGGPNPTSVTQLTGGAILLSHGTAADHSFLQLKENPPAGATYSGWYSGTVSNGSSIAGIHHPAGDLKKISLGSFNGYSEYTGIVDGLGDHSRVTWSSGVTEAGSSGSGIWIQDGISRYLIGTLHGGGSSCMAPNEPDWYGRFDETYNHIYQWVDPGTIIQLQNNVPINNLTDATGNQRSYKIYIPTGAQSLTVSTGGGSGDVDLYIKFGSPPSRFSPNGFDCRSTVVGNSDSCEITNPESGTWHILLNAYSAYSGATLTASYASSITLNPGGAVKRATPGTLEATRVGYAKLSVDSGAAPYATAVFSYKSNGVTITAVGVPTSPPTTRARIFIDFRSGVNSIPARTDSGMIDINTGIAAVNNSSATANVTYRLRNTAGDTLAVGHGTIAAAHHFARFINQLDDVAPDFILPSDFSSSIHFASLEISADQPLSILAVRMTTNQEADILYTTTPVADLTQSLRYTPVYFPQFADGGGYTTSLVLLNTSDVAEEGTLQILDDEGLPLVVNQVGGTADSSFRYLIPSNGTFRFQTDGIPTTAKVGWIRLIPDPGDATPMGSGIFGYNPGSILHSESGIPAVAAITHARIYVDLSENYNTGLALANVGETSASITINAFLNDGITPAGNSKGSLELSGNGHRARFANELVSDLAAGFTGVLDISSLTPFAALTLRALNNERNHFIMTAFPVADANQAAPAPIVFPQIADGGGYISEFILISSGDAAGATLDYYDESGAPF
jgi:lysyl endopeptidase